MQALLAHRVAHALREAGVPLLPRAIAYLTRAVTGVEIHPAAEIGKEFFIDHGSGVVIGETAKIGDCVTLYQGVTLGGTGFQRGKRHPTLGDNVTVGSGAKLLGPIAVGDGAKIGANTVVVEDVPPGATVVGNPGHPVRVEGKRVEGPDADWIHLPDPIAEAIKALSERIAELERRLAELDGGDGAAATRAPRDRSRAPAAPRPAAEASAARATLAVRLGPKGPPCTSAISRPAASCSSPALALTACGGGGNSDEEQGRRNDRNVGDDRPIRPNCTEVWRRSASSNRTAQKKGKAAVKACEEEAEAAKQRRRIGQRSPRSKSTAPRATAERRLRRRRLRRADAGSRPGQRRRPVEAGPGRRVRQARQGEAGRTRSKKKFEEDSSELSTEQASCITEGFEEASQAEVEELSSSGSSEAIDRTGESCAE